MLDIDLSVLAWRKSLVGRSVMVIESHVVVLSSSHFVLMLNIGLHVSLFTLVDLVLSKRSHMTWVCEVNIVFNVVISHSFNQDAVKLLDFDKSLSNVS